MNWKYFDPTFESEIILNDLESPWAGHRYFAYDLIANLKPKTVVELGTHRGTSFFAFCQAVKDQNFECDLFAIDSWKGDPHASFYGEEVYEAVKEIVNKFYSCLQPQLLRMNFDDAIDRFEDNSIDLLHIDGYHTYEAVKHDFESWIGKMSENGIILFHDTAEKRDDFGVFRFWDELKKKFKTIEFYHSHGLGVLLINFDTQGSFPIFKDIWALYYSLYHEKKHLSETLNHYQIEIEVLNKTIKSSNEEVLKLSSETEQKGKELVSLNAIIAQKNIIIFQAEVLLLEKEKVLQEYNNIISEKEILIKSKDNDPIELSHSIHEKDNLIQEKESLLVEARNSIQEKENVIQEKENIIREKEKLVTEQISSILALYNSFSWKFTRPLRCLYSQLIKIFYIFCPYGTKRWFFSKAFLKLFLVSPLNTIRSLKKIVTIAVKDNGSIQNSILNFLKVFRIEGFEGVRQRILQITESIKALEKSKNEFSRNDYTEWIRGFNTLSDEDLKKMRIRQTEFSVKPLISIITPVYNVDSQWLDMCIQSVMDQFYENWELCLHDDASTKKETLECLKKWENIDHRIKISYGRNNQNISAASNMAFKMATGEFVALLDNDDEIKDDALFWIVDEINKHPDADLIYTDECKKTLDNRYIDFIFKPDWSPELLLNDMYTGHFSVYRKSIVEKVGLFRSAYDFSQDYDLALRVTEITEKIYHVERVLYFWRQIEGSAAAGEKEYARQSNLSALGDAFKRRQIKAEISDFGSWANRAKILYEQIEKISIIIPSDSYNNLKKTIDFVVEKTAYVNYEIIPVTNSDLINELKNSYVNSSKKILFSSYDKNFNFSDKCNQGANDATGEILVFLNDDVFPITNDWLENLIEFLHYDKKIGGVSPKLLWENNTIQYAGMTTNAIPFCGTFLKGKDKDEYLAKKVRNTSILSGACFTIRKEVFLEIGGFDSINTPTWHSDLDLSFKLREKGYRCVYTPYATLYHVGNHSWHTKKDKADIFILSKWGKYISNDPYYSKSMRTMLEGYLPEQFGIFSNQTVFKAYSYDALIVLPELSITGAPIIALNTAKVIIKEGGYPVAFSYVDGPLRSEFEKLNVPVIINSLARKDEFSFKYFAKNFDIVIAHTVVVYPAVHMIRNIVPTLWYIHEAQNIESFFIPHFREEIPSLSEVLESTKDTIYVASEYSRDSVKKYSNKVSLLSYGFDDQYNNQEIKIGKKVQFSMVGTIETRKAQDIFVQAILQMSEQYRQKAIFNIIGNDKCFEQFANELKEKTRNIPNVIWHGLIIDQNKKLILFDDTSVFVVVSRDEPASIIVIEGAMLGRPSIISENVGTKYLIEEGKTGFIVETGNVEQLKQTMMNIIDNPAMLISMGKMARKKYLKTSTFDIFQDNLSKAIKENLKKQTNK